MKQSNKALLCALACALLLGGISLACFPAPRFSAQENRYLATFPTADAVALGSGSYTAAIDRYAAERFPARGILRQVNAAFRSALGQRELGDVLLCRNGTLLRRINPNEKVFSQNLRTLAAWQERYGEKLTVGIAPAAVMVLEEVLPTRYDRAQDLAVLQALRERCPLALIFEELTAAEHWYRTDHHWTTKGAYAAYTRLGAALGYTPLAQEEFAITTVSHSFGGTALAASGYPFVKRDEIALYRHPNDTAYQVQINRKDAPFDGFYDFEKLRTQDGYGVFFGGNHGEMTIKDQQTRPSLLVIKDSFANALLPFLAQHFDLTVVDPRYSKNELEHYFEAAEQILVLCGAQTLCEAPFI